MAGADSNENIPGQFQPVGITHRPRVIHPVFNQGPSQDSFQQVPDVGYVPVFASPQGIAPMPRFSYPRPFERLAHLFGSGLNSPGVSPRRAVRQRIRTRFFAAQRNRNMSPDSFSSLGTSPGLLPAGPNITGPQGFNWPRFEDYPPPHIVMPRDIFTELTVAPLIPPELCSVTLSTERMSGRASRPLVPTVKSFQPASAYASPVVERMTAKATEENNPLTSGSPMPQVEKRTPCPLSAEVEPFMPRSERMAYALMEDSSKKNENNGLDDVPEPFTHQKEAHPCMFFLEEARLKEANNPLFSLQPRIEMANPTQPESEDHEFSVTSQSTFSPEDCWPGQRFSSEHHRQLESVDEGVLLDIPTPVYHAHQEIAYPSYASEFTPHPSNEYVDSYGTLQIDFGGPTGSPDHGPSPLRLTGSEAEVLNRATEQQARLWKEVERSETEGLEMEDSLAERRGLVQQVLKAREDARLERESNDLTRPEALARDHHRRDEASTREAICRIEFKNRIWHAIYPFWSEQPNPRLPHAHIRAEAIESQEMVSTFETVFCNLAGYRESYTNYQASRPALPEMSPGINQLLHRQPRWMPGPTRTNWDNPNICDVSESRRTILDTGSFISYKGPTDMNHFPHPRDPCIEPLIGEEDLPWIPPFNPVFPESPQVNALVNETSLDISSPAEEAYAQQQCGAPASVQSTPPRMGRCTDLIRSSQARAQSDITNFENKSPHSPASMARNRTTYQQGTQNSTSSSNDTPRGKRRRRRH